MLLRNPIPVRRIRHEQQDHLRHVFLILLFASASVDAQPQEEHDEEPPSDCLADWDPFCPPRSPSDGYAYTSGCFDCDYIPEGPNGEPSYYVCSDVGVRNGGPSRCTNYSWGCEMGGLCQIA